MKHQKSEKFYGLEKITDKFKKMKLGNLIIDDNKKTMISGIYVIKAKLKEKKEFLIVSISQNLEHAYKKMLRKLTLFIKLKKREIQKMKHRDKKKAA